MSASIVPTHDQSPPSSGRGGFRSTAPSSGAPSNLATLPPEECAQELFRLLRQQEPLYKRRRTQWKANRLRRAGVAGVYVRKATDKQEWTVYAPPGASKQVPALNKAARQCRLLRATMFSDPPVPEAVPARDTDEARDAAQFATRALIDLGNEGNLDNTITAAQAFDLASTYDSGFRHYYVDPQGSLQPWAVQVPPLAQQFDPANPKAVLLDPATQQPVPPPYVTKFVRTDLTLAEDDTDPAVQRVWTNTLKCEVLTAGHVRFLPAFCDLWSAQGLLIIAYLPLSAVKRRFPEVRQWSEERLQSLVSMTGEQEFQDLLPGGPKMRSALMGQEKLSDDAPVLVLTCYYKAGPEYPKGFYGVAAGTTELLHRSDWWDSVNNESLDLPADQFRQMDDELDPMGMGMMRVVGPGNEIRSGTLGSLLEHLDRFLNRKVFYPMNSPLQPRAMQAATGTYIPIALGGEPKMEQVPDFPKPAIEMFGLISAEMDHESGLEPPVSGQNPKQVQSGLHARTILEQVSVGLSDIKNNVVRALTRGWRVQLQQIRARYSVPQRIAWVGDDGAFKERWWTGADLGSTKDVQLHPGTLSMLAPSAKLALTEHLAAFTVGQQPLLDAETVRRMVIGNSGGLLGLQDEPHRLRIRRQVSVWESGPPAGVELGAAAAKLWAPVAADDQPDVAAIRAYELGRLMASLRWARHPEPWQAPALAEYHRMRQAAGLYTLAEQQQAQQQQQVVQQQQVQAQQLQQGVARAIQQVQAQLDALGQAVKQAPKEQQAALETRLAKERKDVEGLLLKTAQLLKPEPAAAPAPLTIQVPELETQGNAVAAALAEFGKRQEGLTRELGAAVMTLQAAVKELAARPTSFALTKTGKGYTVTGQ